MNPVIAIFSWDSPKFSNFRFLQFWDFSEMSCGLFWIPCKVKLNCNAKICYTSTTNVAPYNLMNTYYLTSLPNCWLLLITWWIPITWPVYQTVDKVWTFIQFPCSLQFGYCSANLAISNPMRTRTNFRKSWTVGL